MMKAVRDFDPVRLGDFDPVRLGEHEAAAWVAYYQHRWAALLRAAMGMVRVGFGLSWLATLRGAWLVLRANQAWAPYPENDPDRARALMRRFYALVTAATGERFDLDEAARLEIEWWRVHRYLQREAPDGSTRSLAEAVAALYAHVYRRPIEEMLPAAAHRAAAMRISDAWVEAGKDPASPSLAAERAELVKGYTLLRAALR
ncbi:MAG: hypothetical protein ACM30G_12385 [Micromonosporaceae bacterium]